MSEITDLTAYRLRREGGHRSSEVIDERRPAEPRAAARNEPPRVEPLLREVYGEVLRDNRRRRGERLSDVASRAAISPQYLSEIERGRKDASSEIIAAVARALDVPVRTLSAQVTSRLIQSGSSSPICLAA
ncbi:helix-turn-helix transcriptional regulator [Arthrobacter echini]|uniref:Helix-turn-helix transcriptional regulator n=1 Tax=Arthrobacter echini TaxID=1529066 RepID=A0A4S5E189_9MICC|nr:helix-turn-helix transcriptional regulator [Arthrobacter echini]THJ65111.1 helix-turn-helix transcriptional regulator [Arthrobacter echini]